VLPLMSANKMARFVVLGAIDYFITANALIGLYLKRWCQAAAREILFVYCIGGEGIIH
jgi:hypothetical protein